MIKRLSAIIGVCMVALLQMEVDAFLYISHSTFSRQLHIRGTHLYAETIISPFDASVEGGGKGNIDSDDDRDEFELSLTRENVEIVLDEMRPFLQADGYITIAYF